MCIFRGHCKPNNHLSNRKKQKVMICGFKNKSHFQIKIILVGKSLKRCSVTHINVSKWIIYINVIPHFCYSSSEFLNLFFPLVRMQFRVLNLSLHSCHLRHVSFLNGIVNCMDIYVMVLTRVKLHTTCVYLAWFLVSYSS